MTTRLLLILLAALGFFVAAAQSTDSLSCVTLTTTNGRQHLVQVVSESQYVYKMQFCNDPTGQVVEVPKAQVVQVERQVVRIPFPSTVQASTNTLTTPQVVTASAPITQPTTEVVHNEIPPTPWNKAWRRAALVKAPLWGRYEVHFQQRLFENFTLGLAYQNWSVNRKKSIYSQFYDRPYSEVRSNQGNRLLVFGKVHKRANSGAYVGSGIWYGGHKLYHQITYSPDGVTLYQFPQSARMRAFGTEIQAGVLRVFKNHVLIDIGAAFSLLLKARYLEQTSFYRHPTFQLRGYIMVGIAL